MVDFRKPSYKHSPNTYDRAYGGLYHSELKKKIKEELGIDVGDDELEAIVRERISKHQERYDRTYKKYSDDAIAASPLMPVRRNLPFGRKLIPVHEKAEEKENLLELMQQQRYMHEDMYIPKSEESYFKAIRDNKISGPGTDPTLKQMGAKFVQGITLDNLSFGTESDPRDPISGAGQRAVDASHFVGVGAALGLITVATKSPAAAFAIYEAASPENVSMTMALESAGRGAFVGGPILGSTGKVTNFLGKKLGLRADTSAVKPVLKAGRYQVKAGKQFVDKAGKVYKAGKFIKTGDANWSKVPKLLRENLHHAQTGMILHSYEVTRTENRMPTTEELLDAGIAFVIGGNFAGVLRNPGKLRPENLQKMAEQASDGFRGLLDKMGKGQAETARASASDPGPRVKPDKAGRTNPDDQPLTRAEVRRVRVVVDEIKNAKSREEIDAILESTERRVQDHGEVAFAVGEAYKKFAPEAPQDATSSETRERGSRAQEEPLEPPRQEGFKTPEDYQVFMEHVWPSINRTIDKLRTGEIEYPQEAPKQIGATRQDRSRALASRAEQDFLLLKHQEGQKVLEPDAAIVDPALVDHASKSGASTVVAMGEALGVPVVFVNGAKRDVAFAGTIMLRAGHRDHKVGTTFVFGHELFHTLKAHDPVAFKELLGAIAPIKGSRRWRGLVEQGYEEGKIPEELGAEILGELMAEGNFNQIFEQASPRLKDRVTHLVRSMLARIQAFWNRDSSQSVESYRLTKDFFRSRAGKALADMAGVKFDNNVRKREIRWYDPRSGKPIELGPGRRESRQVDPASDGQGPQLGRYADIFMAHTDKAKHVTGAHWIDFEGNTPKSTIHDAASALSAATRPGEIFEGSRVHVVESESRHPGDVEVSVYLIRDGAESVLKRHGISGRVEDFLKRSEAEVFERGTKEELAITELYGPQDGFKRTSETEAIQAKETSVSDVSPSTPPRVAAQGEATTSSRADIDNSVKTAAAGRIAMKPDNVEKVLSGSKTMTSRTKKIEEGEYLMPGGTRVVVSNPRKVTISEIDGEAWARAEGFDSLDHARRSAKFGSTRQFINGKRSIWIHDVRPAGATRQGRLNLSGEARPIERADHQSLVGHSGGAKGSDTYWGESVEKSGGSVRHYRPRDIKRNDPEGSEQVKKAAHRLGKKWPSGRTWGLMMRNWLQVKNSDEVFAVAGSSTKSAFDKNGNVVGGTGWAVAMAHNNGRVVHVFDQLTRKWYRGTGKDWVEEPTPSLTPKPALIGARELQTAGKKAIDDVVSRPSRPSEYAGRTTTEPTRLGERPSGNADFRTPSQAREIRERDEFDKDILDRNFGEEIGPRSEGLGATELSEGRVIERNKRDLKALQSAIDIASTASVRKRDGVTAERIVDQELQRAGRYLDNETLGEIDKAAASEYRATRKKMVAVVKSVLEKKAARPSTPDPEKILTRPEAREGADRRLLERTPELESEGHVAFRNGREILWEDGTSASALISVPIESSRIGQREGESLGRRTGEVRGRTDIEVLAESPAEGLEYISRELGGRAVERANDYVSKGWEYEDVIATAERTNAGLSEARQLELTRQIESIGMTKPEAANLSGQLAKLHPSQRTEILRQMGIEFAGGTEGWKVSRRTVELPGTTRNRAPERDRTLPAGRRQRRASDPKLMDLEAQTRDALGDKSGHRYDTILRVTETLRGELKSTSASSDATGIRRSRILSMIADLKAAFEKGEC